MAVRWCRDWDSFRLDAGIGDGPVAFGGDLSPDGVLSGYRHGVLPFPAPDEYHRTLNEVRYEEQVAAGLIALMGAGGADPYGVAWWCPDPRPVIAADQVHLGRNVRKRLRREPGWTTTADTAFERVAEQCRAGREPRWLTGALLESLVVLHEKGWAHSVEVWQDGELVGGAFGVATGPVLSGDSIFGRQPEAGRVAVADLAARFAAAGGQLIDAQWDSPFLRSLGAKPLARDVFLKKLRGPAERVELPGERQPARRLLP